MTGTSSFPSVLKYELLLLLVSLIWGSTFVAQQIGMEQGLGPMTFNALRSALGGVSLVPVILWRKKSIWRLPTARGGCPVMPWMQLARGVILAE